MRHGLDRLVWCDNLTIFIFSVLQSVILKYLLSKMKPTRSLPYKIEAPGLTMSSADCMGLVHHIDSLPVPSVVPPDHVPPIILPYYA
jgi:hypothetical protein